MSSKAPDELNLRMSARVDEVRDKIVQFLDRAYRAGHFRVFGKGQGGDGTGPVRRETLRLLRDDAGILLFVLPRRSPKLNGHVERAHRTHVEEFSDFYDGKLTMGPLNRALREWEAYYNAERPHQLLGWLSPMEYLAEQRLGTAF